MKTALLLLFTVSLQSKADYEIIDAKICKIQTQTNYSNDSGKYNLHLLLTLKEKERTFTLKVCDILMPLTQTEYAYGSMNGYIRTDILNEDCHTKHRETHYDSKAMGQYKIFGKNKFDNPISEATKQDLFLLFKSIQPNEVSLSRSLKFEKFYSYGKLISQHIRN